MALFALFTGEDVDNLAMKAMKMIILLPDNILKRLFKLYEEEGSEKLLIDYEIDTSSSLVKINLYVQTFYNISGSLTPRWLI